MIISHIWSRGSLFIALSFFFFAFYHATMDILKNGNSVPLIRLLRTIHSVNEHISASSHVSAVAFVYEYIVNVNEYGHD